MTARTPEPAELTRQQQDAHVPRGSVYSTRCGGALSAGGSGPVNLGCPSGDCGPQALVAAGLSDEEVWSLAAAHNACGEAEALLQAQGYAPGAARAAASALRACRADRPEAGTLVRVRGEVALAVPGGFVRLIRDRSGLSARGAWPQPDPWRPRGPLQLVAYGLTVEQAWRAARAPGDLAAEVACAPPPRPGQLVPCSEVAWRRLPEGTVVRDTRITGIRRVVVCGQGKIRYLRPDSRGRWEAPTVAEPWVRASTWIASGAESGIVEATRVPTDSADRLNEAASRLEARRARAAEAGEQRLPGEVVDGLTSWAVLPFGSVVDSGDGSSCPYLVRGRDGWGWAVSNVALGGKPRDAGTPLEALATLPTETACGSGSRQGAPCGYYVGRLSGWLTGDDFTRALDALLQNAAAAQAEARGAA